MVPPENFWRIDPDLSNPGIVAESVKWINPRYIVCIEDHAAREGDVPHAMTATPTIQVTMASALTYGSWDISGGNVLKFTGHQREQILRYLADIATP